MAQQTAVEWYIEQIENVQYNPLDKGSYDTAKKRIIEQAKQMEKNLKKRAWIDGNDTDRCIRSTEVDECFDDYYTETYKNE